MAFEANIAFALGLIALACGTALAAWAAGQQGACTKCAKLTGNAVAVLAVLSLLCTGFESYHAWKNGTHRRDKKNAAVQGMNPMMMMQNMQSMPGMMRGMPMNNQMMPGMMMQNGMMPPQGMGQSQPQLQPNAGQTPATPPTQP